ncbi:MAG: hypothetical protein ACE5D7_04065, partial [Fidelibacterota bacterium]
MLKSVKCAVVCGKESDHDIVKSFRGIDEYYLDTLPDNLRLPILPFRIQRCPNCGYCSPDISELIKGADEH